MPSNIIGVAITITLIAIRMLLMMTKIGHGKKDSI